MNGDLRIKVCTVLETILLYTLMSGTMVWYGMIRCARNYSTILDAFHFFTTPETSLLFVIYTL
jgi:hypothetical protein